MLHSSPSAGRDRRVSARRVGRGRRRILIVGGDPDLDGAQLIVRTTALVLVATLSAAIVMSLLSLATTPVGWVVTAAAALLGAVVPWAHQRHQRRSTRSLALGELAPRWAAQVNRAASQAAHLRQFAERAPDGPVAEHLHRLAEIADDYVLLLHEAAVNANAATVRGDPPGDCRPDDPGLGADMATMNGELAELLEAAERLRAAQQRQLEPSPLAALTAQTDRLAVSLEDAAGDRPDPEPSSGDGRELPPRNGFG